MTKEVTATITAFSGLNLDSVISSLEDSELSEAVNLNLNRNGLLAKRPGYVTQTTLGTEPGIILGYWKSPTVSAVVYAENTGAGTTTIHIVGDTTETIAISDDITWGLQYVDDFYVMGTTGIHKIEFASGSFSAAEPNTTADPQVAIIHKERMFWAGPTNPSRLWFSDIGDIGTYAADAFLDVNQGDKDRIMAMTILDDNIVIFKQTSIWVLYVTGEPALWTLKNIANDLGCVSKHGIVQHEQLTYFCANSGVYVTDGVTFTNLSTKIEEFYKDRILSEDKDLITVWDNRLITKAQAGADYRIFVYGFRSQGWTEWDLSAEPTSFLFNVYDDPGQGLYFSSTNNLRKFDRDSYQDDGVDYEIAFSTKNFDFGEATLMKRGKWAGLDIEGAGTAFLSHYSDNILQNPVISAQPQALRRVIKLRGPGYFRTWRIRVTATHSNNFVFYGLILHMAVKRPVIGTIT